MLSALAAIVWPGAAGAQVVDADRPRVELGGRVLVRSTVSTVEAEGVETQYVHDQSVSSARASMSYRRDDALEAVVELEVGDGDPELDDGYIILQLGCCGRVQLGRFKRPISPIALASRRHLPAVERGLLNEVRPIPSRVTARLPFGGRGDGVQVAFEGRGVALEPRFELGVFEAELASSAPISLADDVAVDPYARMVLALGRGVDLGASFALVTHETERAVSPAIGHAPWGSVDLSFAHGDLRGYLEGYLGHSIVMTETAGVGGAMWATRALVWYRFSELHAGIDRLEPFAAVSALDPRTGVKGDRALEVGAGCAWRIAGDLRAQLHVRRQLYQDVVLLGRASGSDAFVQLGAWF